MVHQQSQKRPWILDRPGPTSACILQNEICYQKCIYMWLFTVEDETVKGCSGSYKAWWGIGMGLITLDVMVSGTHGQFFDAHLQGFQQI